MSATATIRALLRQFTGQENTLVVPRAFIKLTGDHVAALILNQVLYWSDRTTDPDGWFYKTAEEWEEELCISRFQLDRSRKVLTPLGLRTELRKVGGAPKVHYRLDFECFVERLQAFLQELDFQETSKSKSPILKKPENQETRKSISKNLAKPLTEITDKDYPTSQRANAHARSNFPSGAAPQDTPHTAAPEAADEPLIEESSTQAILPPPAQAAVESVSLETIPAAPDGQPPLERSPLGMWQRYVEDRPSKVRRAKLDGLAGNHTAYWLARAIDHAADCDGALDADADRALNYVASILKRWKRENAYGSNHPDYQAKQEHKEHTDERSAQRRDAELERDDRAADRQGRTAPTGGAGGAGHPELRARHLPVRLKPPPAATT